MVFRVLVNLLQASLYLMAIFIFALPPLTLVSGTTPSQNFPVAMAGCEDRCGSISIPYPFGTTEQCYKSQNFWVTCNHTSNPPKLFWKNTTFDFTNISLDGQVKLLRPIAHDCYAPNGTRISHFFPWTRIPTFFTFSHSANKFTILGCDAIGYVSGKQGNRNYTTGCTALCETKDDLIEGSCDGVGCCQTSIPEDSWRVYIELYSFWNHSRVKDFNSCSYAFLVEESAFKFSPDNLTNLTIYEKLPIVVDWVIGKETCEEAEKNSSSYACKSRNSICRNPKNISGYRCHCKEGYQGNPYLNDGCQDIDECKEPDIKNKCKYGCVNTEGGFNCPCPKGYHGDGRIGGQGCTRGESLVLRLVTEHIENRDVATSSSTE